MTMNSAQLGDVINDISRREFGREPDRLTRMIAANCSEVFTAVVGEQEYIFRLNREPRFFRGTRRNIALFALKGIPVPEILSEDLRLTRLPVAFQVQNKIAGQDIDAVIAHLSDDELRGVSTLR